MDASAVEILGAVLGSGGVVSILWAWGNANKKEYVDSLLEQIKALKANSLSSETARIAADQAKSLAEKRAGEIEIKYTHLKQSAYKMVKALNKARVWVDPGSMVGMVSEPPEWSDSSAVIHVEAAKQTDYFLGHLSERDEAERRRQKPLNPSTEHDEELQRYLDQMDRQRR